MKSYLYGLNLPYFSYCFNKQKYPILNIVNENSHSQLQYHADFVRYLIQTNKKRLGNYIINTILITTTF